MFGGAWTKLGSFGAGLLVAFVILLLLISFLSASYLQERNEISELRNEVSTEQAVISQYQSEVTSLQSQISSLLSQIYAANATPPSLYNPPPGYDILTVVPSDNCTAMVYYGAENESAGSAPPLQATRFYLEDGTNVTIWITPANGCPTMSFGGVGYAGPPETGTDSHESFTMAGDVISLPEVNMLLDYQSVIGSSSPLEFSASVQPAQPTSGEGVTVLTQVLNPLSITVAYDAVVMTSPAYGPCEQDLLTGAKAYAGYYTMENISTATQLLLYDPNGIYTCPTPLQLYRQTFLPGASVNESVQLKGYWTVSGNSSTFHQFSQGYYTVLAFDNWGHQALLHFMVQP